MEASFVPRINHGIMDEEEEDELGSMSSFSDDDDDDEEEEEEEEGEVCGGSRSSSSSSLGGPLFEMSSLFSQLPFKRGLSKHFEGKSQSFTSLSSVRNLEDLVKPSRRNNIKVVMKSSKSYGWGLGSSHNKKLSPRGCSRTITKKNSTGTSTSRVLVLKRIKGSPIAPCT